MTAQTIATTKNECPFWLVVPGQSGAFWQVVTKGGQYGLTYTTSDGTHFTHYTCYGRGTFTLEGPFYQTFGSFEEAKAAALAIEAGFRVLGGICQ